MLHISIAVASLLQTTYAWFRPTQQQLMIGYGLVAATLVSGTLLVVAQPGHMAAACVSGLAYMSAVSLGLGLARHKLQRAAADLLH
jgi:hypothetical protein